MGSYGWGLINKKTSEHDARICPESFSAITLLLYRTARVINYRGLLMWFGPNWSGASMYNTRLDNRRLWYNACCLEGVVHISHSCMPNVAIHWVNVTWAKPSMEHPMSFGGIHPYSNSLRGRGTHLGSNSCAGCPLLKLYISLPIVSSNFAL